MNYTKISKIVIGVVIGITLFLGYFLTKVGFDYSMRNFYPMNHPETDFFMEYTSKFEWDDDYVLIGLETKAEDIFNIEFLEEVDSFARLLGDLPEISSVASPTDLEIYKYIPYMDMLTSSPLLHLDEPERLSRDSQLVYDRQELVGRLFAPDAQSVAIMLRQQPGMEYEACDALVDKIDSLVQPFTAFEKVHFAGKCYGQTTFVDLSRTEVVTFVGLSVIVIIICLLVAYRSFWGVWIPLTVVGVTVVWTVGTMMLFGQKLDFISNIIPTAILIIGIANIIHLFTKFLIKLDEGLPKIEALKIAIRKVGAATILTSLTTIIGFMSLFFSNVKPLVNMGAYASLGLVYALILTYTLFPAILVLYKGNFTLKRKPQNDFWNQRLERLFNWVMRHKVAVVLGSLALLGFGSWGSLQLQVNQHILEDISESHPQIVSSRYFENDFSGTRQFEMQVKLKDSTQSVLDYEVLQKLYRLETFLMEDYGVGSLFSPVGVVKEAFRIQHAGNNDYYKLPPNARKMKKTQKLIERYLEESGYPKVYTEDRQIGRFAGKMPDMGSYPVGQLNEKLANFMDTSGLNKAFSYHLTGSAHLMDINNGFIAQNVFYGLLFCFFVIMVIMGFLFRSLKMAIIALVPNILPLLIVGGIMGMMGINIKISTSILFIISFGIAVDDSIHFLSGFRFEQLASKDRMKALLKTFQSTGKAIVVTTLILSAGFSTLVFSSFKGTYHIGLFTSLCLIIALFADLVLLPVLVYYMTKDRRSLSGARVKSQESGGGSQESSDNPL